MTRSHADHGAHRPDAPTGRWSERNLFGALVLCCAGPMLLLIVLTSVLGVAVGPAAAIAVGVVAAGICVAVMIQRHRHT